jgi:hypothetical protein
MGKNEKTPITIDGKEYQFEDLTDEQKVMFNHCLDLDRKIDQMRFNIDQLAGGKEFFITKLKASLEQE